MRRYTTEEFIRRARLVHGDKYNYDKVVYIISQKKVEIVCPIHGLFSKTCDAPTRTRMPLLLQT